MIVKLMYTESTVCFYLLCVTKVCIMSICLSLISTATKKANNQEYVRYVSFKYKYKSLHFQPASAPGCSYTRVLMQVAQRDSLTHLCSKEMVQSGFGVSSNMITAWHVFH